MRKRNPGFIVRLWRAFFEDGREVLLTTREQPGKCPEVLQWSPSDYPRRAASPKRAAVRLRDRRRAAAMARGAKLASDRRLFVGAILLPLDKLGRINPGNRFRGGEAEFRHDGFCEALVWHAAEIRRALKMPRESAERRAVFARTQAVGVPVKEWLKKQELNQKPQTVAA